MRVFIDNSKNEKYNSFEIILKDTDLAVFAFDTFFLIKHVPSKKMVAMITYPVELLDDKIILDDVYSINIQKVFVENKEDSKIYCLIVKKRGYQ